MKTLLAIIIGLSTLTACKAPAPQPKAPDDVALVVPTLIKSGFIRLSQEPNHFVDANKVMKGHIEDYLVYFDVVVNLEKSKYAYPEKPELYAKSLRRKHVVNCDTQTMEQLSTAYYTEFWGEGEKSPEISEHIQLVQDYKKSQLYILGKLICSKLYRDK
ncbi:Uncharacterised protein [Pasteurella multocida]|nr:Uncharacterised protein [Pasteurella multocida]